VVHAGLAQGQSLEVTMVGVWEIREDALTLHCDSDVIACFSVNAFALASYAARSAKNASAMLECQGKGQGGKNEVQTTTTESIGL
jgi:hypothetical protein